MPRIIINNLSGGDIKDLSGILVQAGYTVTKGKGRVKNSPVQFISITGMELIEKELEEPKHETKTVRNGNKTDG